MSTDNKRWVIGYRKDGNWILAEPAQGRYTSESWHYVTPRGPEQERESVEDIYPDHEWIDLYESGALTAEQLRRTGAVLMRYLDRVKRAGRDY